MNATEIRQSFLDFFAEKGHHIVPSAPVIPQDDPTLMFTNAGMNQFKPYFLGQATPAHRRVADSQKCIRVSGKHNDLEEVGIDTYHHTLFEMLGNWSFGDYYKREAISWAWELLTQRWKLPKERLYVTVFGGDPAKGLPADEEAERLWKEVTNLDPTHLQRFGTKDNFWMMGEVGPCGPCSEIHIDLTPDLSGGSLVNSGSPLVMELWNLVFTEFNAAPDGLHKLPNCNVDTGAGLERIAAVMECTQNCTNFNVQLSNYDTALFKPLIHKLEELSGQRYTPGISGDDISIAMRVCADHLRMVAFSIADGALPSNEGRGYVIRRILRRAARYGRKLGLVEPFLYKLLPTLIEVMGQAYPELEREREKIARLIKGEETSFNQTLDRGLSLFEEGIAQLAGCESCVFPGEVAFKLYDTYGFPYDLTVVMARERGYEVDEAAFQSQMQAQKERARAARVKTAQIAESQKLDLQPTHFVGYLEDHCLARVVAIIGAPGQRAVVLDRTPFYGEMGGQVGDCGLLRWEGHALEVRDTKQQEGVVLHLVEEGPQLEALQVGQEVEAAIDVARRRAIERHHTATHLLHYALRRFLGNEVHQQGSLVAPDRLRFDFTYPEALGCQRLAQIERFINEKIVENSGVAWFEIELQAKPDSVISFFGDKYGQRVRVLNVGGSQSAQIEDPCYDGFSQELCGGCHCTRTGDLGSFKFISEGAIAAGVRRVEAVAGMAAFDFVANEEQHLRCACQDLHANPQELNQRLHNLLEQQKRLERELEKAKANLACAQAKDVLSQARTLAGVPTLVLRLESASPDELRQMADQLKERFQGIAILAGPNQGKVGLLALVTPQYVKEGYQAGKIVKELAKLLGGGGGGRPDMALAGAQNLAELENALGRVEEIIAAQKA